MIRTLSWPVMAASAALCGCVPATVVPVAAGVGGEIAVFHRSLFDLLYSSISGRDCSVVNLDEGNAYCRRVEPPVPPIPYCTRSLGTVDCWSDPALLADHPPQVADGPMQLTARQNEHRLARWPAGGEDILARPPVEREGNTDP